MVVRVMLAQIAVEIVKTLLVRHAFVAGHPQPPLADQARGIAGAAEHFGDGHILVSQHLGPGVLRPRIAADAGVPRVQAGHQHAAGQGADGGPRIELREPQPLGGHAVEVGRLNDLLAIAAQVPVAQVVGKDEYDVWYTPQFSTNAVFSRVY